MGVSQPMKIEIELIRKMVLLLVNCNQPVSDSFSDSYIPVCLSVYTQSWTRQTAGKEDRTWASGCSGGHFSRFIHQWPHQLPQEELCLNEPWTEAPPFLPKPQNQSTVADLQKHGPKTRLRNEACLKVAPIILIRI